ncbi:MAG: HlyD family secretion protein, partial [Armatimonadetes bacterium]|nr:HlyD family secretion protein [Armatimonadota bacterium]
MSKSQRNIVVALAAVLLIGVLVGLYLTGHLGPRPPVGAVPPGHVAQPAGKPTATPAKPLGLSLQGRVEAARDHQVTAPREATVLALAAPEGQPVVQGQLLIQLDVPALRGELAAARKELDQVKSLVEKANDPTLRARLQAAEANAQHTAQKQEQMQAELDAFTAQHPEVPSLLATLQVAQAEATSASLAFQRVSEEFRRAQEAATRTGKPSANFNEIAGRYAEAQRRNSEAQARFDQARAARQQRRAEIVQFDLLRRRVTSGRETLKQAQAALKKLRQTPAVAMIAQGRQRVQQATARVTALEAEVEKLAVKAPVAGMLRELKARPGQKVPAGAVLAVVSEAGGSRLVCEARAQDTARLA